MSIHVKVLAGLANKLRAIESGVSLSKDLNCPLEVIWVPDHQMVAKYHELFCPSDLFDVTGHDRYRFSRSSFLIKGLKKPIVSTINSLYGLDLSFNDVDIGQQVRPRIWDIGSIARGKHIYISTCHDFYPYRYNFSWVKPLPEIGETIESFTEKIRGKNCIGLHIRRTDNAVAKEQSPDRLFEEAVKEEIRKNEETIFFLATDDAATEKHFIRLFGPQRILVYPKMFGRDSVQATRDAVVDWFLLGKCSKLYCSYYSSFSETAASVAGTPAITLKL
jgi:hypothetical protein